MNKHALGPKPTTFAKNFSIAALKQILASFFGKGKSAIDRGELTPILLRIVEAIDSNDRYLTYVERRGPAILFRNTNGNGATSDLIGGSLLRGTTNMYYSDLGGTTPALAGWSPLTDDWGATAGTVGYLSSNAVLVDTSTGKMFQYQHTGAYDTYTAANWVLVYTPPAADAGAITTLTGTIAASGTENIAVGSGKLVSHITLIKTDAEATPTVTLAIQAGATLLNTVPFDEADSTVLATDYMRNGATVLQITPNCAVSYIVYIAN